MASIYNLNEAGALVWTYTYPNTAGETVVSVHTYRPVFVANRTGSGVVHWGSANGAVCGTSINSRSGFGRKVEGGAEAITCKRCLKKSAGLEVIAA